MHPKPKNHIALYGAASLLAAAGISAILNSGGSSPAVAKTSPPPGKSSPAAAIGNRMAETALAAQGLLWERGAAGQKELRASIPVQAGPLRAVVGQAAGDRVKLDLSDRFAALAGEITGSSVQDDGTVITHIRIDGEPQGTLTVQENKALGFFLGQLYFDAHPVAYEFRPSGSGLMATRHALSDLLCSMLNQNLDGIEAAGLPPLDKVKAQAALKSEEEAKAKNKLIQEAKPGGEQDALPALEPTGRGDQAGAADEDHQRRGGEGVAGEVRPQEPRVGRQQEDQPSPAHRHWNWSPCISASPGVWMIGTSTETSCRL